MIIDKTRGIIKATIGIAVSANGDWRVTGNSVPIEKPDDLSDVEFWPGEAQSELMEWYSIKNDVPVQSWSHVIEIPIPTRGESLPHVSDRPMSADDVFAYLSQELFDLECASERAKLDAAIKQKEQELAALRRLRQYAAIENMKDADDFTAFLCLNAEALEQVREWFGPSDPEQEQRIVPTGAMERKHDEAYDPQAERPHVALGRPPAAEPAAVVTRTTPPEAPAEPAGTDEPAEQSPPAEPVNTVRPLSLNEQRRERSRKRREQKKVAEPNVVPDDCHLTTTAAVEEPTVEPEPTATVAEQPQKPTVAQETARQTVHDDIRDHLTRYGGKPTVHDLSRFWSLTAREIVGAISGMDDVEVCQAGYVRFRPGFEPAEAA